MKADSLYGSRISLISKSKIRYLGILHEINEQESTVALEHVRSMGTEGRKGGDPGDEIPPSQELFDFIQFRATDVIDIRLEEPEEPTTPPPPPPAVPDDPAILGASAAPRASQPLPAQAPANPPAGNPAPPPPAYAAGPPHPHYMMPPSGVAGPYWNGPSPGPTPQQYPGPPQVETTDLALATEDARHQPQHAIGDRQYDSSAHDGLDGYRGRGRGRGGNRRRPSGYRYNAPAGQRIPVPKSDFDFQSSNAKFSKDDLLKEFVNLAVSDSGSVPVTPTADVAATVNEAESVVIPPADNFYNKKSSFFDNISCENKERSQGSQLGPDERRSRIHEERKLNVETFGQAQSNSGRYNRFNNNRGYRGGRGNQHRGGGGGYRGRGRGQFPPSHGGFRYDSSGSYGGGPPAGPAPQ
ncbi:hypothetical protein IWQ60_009642 [Tieghemiomyces parasiticus]|uniref:Uncharacterized protein n=1 Tax=Tieghemiomyces parasiticus TaxID=78921 RepID=A0A9W7ZMC6_9FUNG|nr:hypothetical protein IWQ60_009642 [Tieghemiomyces parasiticus]